ncbi:MAG: nucleotide exchange factor GrpE [Planctomycetales bacterium]|nr:nucleotide exchange factor GrpE [Planctomycetales bacterium]MCA9220878.1 nucleotide exchange factor GrpE [Planctomycetales bacterium]
MRTWWENEEIMRQFREWLTETRREVEPFMPERSARDREPSSQDDVASRLSDAPVDDGQDGDDDAVETVDADDVRDEKEGQRVGVFGASEEYSEFREAADVGDEPLDPLPTVGLLSLVEAFTALRHELKLQTKGARGLESQVEAALGGLDSARRQLESVRSREDEVIRRATRSFAESLAEIDEAVLRGFQAIEAWRRQARTPRSEDWIVELRQQFQSQSAWQRWRSGRWQKQVERHYASLRTETDDESRGLQTIAEGYQLLIQRLQRVLGQHGVTRIECLGKKVDPTRMTVVETSHGGGQPAETVIAEVRPGYEWRGEVIRFAEVRAAAS